MPVSKGLSLALAIAAAPALAGDLKGVVRYLGPEPNLPRLAVVRDETTCGQDVPDDSLDVADGRLRNVVVRLKGAASPRPAPGVAIIDQKGCRFVPHVQAVAAGSTLRIGNSDPVFHNVHAYLGDKPSFNVATPLKNMKKELKLEQSGILRLRCDVHPWMEAYVVVSEGPYAVVAADGTYTIRGLPAGSYTVTAWQEKLGEKTVQVTIPAAGEVRADFSFAQ